MYFYIHFSSLYTLNEQLFSYFYLYLNEQFNMTGTLFWQHKTVWFEKSQTFEKKKKIDISSTSPLLLCCYLFEIHNILHVIYSGML